MIYQISRHFGRVVKATDLNFSSQVSVSLVSAGSNPAGVVVTSQFFFSPFLPFGVCWTLDETSDYLDTVGKEGGGWGEP